MLDTEKTGKWRVVVRARLWLQRAQTQPLYFLTAVLIVLIVCVLLLIAYSWSIATASATLDQYCNKDPQSGDEGTQVAGMKLRYVVLTVRHGDRTSISGIPGISSWERPHLDNKNDRYDTPYIEPEALSYTPALASFKLRELDPACSDHDHPCEKNMKQRRLLEEGQAPVAYAALDPGDIFSVPDYLLSKGMLTTRGFMQHIRIGTHLSKAYASLLSSITDPSQLKVRSTNYFRTIRSVSALLIGMFHSSSSGLTLSDEVGPDSKSNPKIVIDVFANRQDEWMLGTIKRLPHNGQAQRVPCALAKMLRAQQDNSFVPQPTVADSFEQMFGKGIVKGESKVLTEFADAADTALPRYCHGRPLPCSHSGECMTVQMLEDLFDEGARFYGDRFHGSNGGRRSTGVAMYTFLQEILSDLHKATDDSTAQPDYPRQLMSVYSGHDTVISPVLNALGVLAGWPSYASRVTFELWEVDADSASHATAAGEFFVRVLFNGQDVTQKIPLCSGLNLWGVGQRLCPLRRLQAQVEALVGPEGLEAECAMPE